MTYNSMTDIMSRLLEYLYSIMERSVLAAPFMMLLLLMATACNSKKTMVSETVSERNVRESEKMNSVQETDIRLTDLIRTDCGIRINYTRYDSSKPPDSLTNRPPVIEDGNIDITFNQEQNTNVDVDDRKSVDTDKKKEETEREETETEQVSVVEDPDFMENILLAGAFLILCFIILKLIAK